MTEMDEIDAVQAESCSEEGRFRTHSTTTRDRTLQFRAPSPLDFLEFSSVDFVPFLQVYCVT